MAGRFGWVEGGSAVVALAHLSSRLLNHARGVLPQDDVVLDFVVAEKVRACKLNRGDVFEYSMRYRFRCTH